MGVLFNPFKLFGRLLIAGFKITGYCVTFVIQVILCLYTGQRAKITDAVGVLGRSVTDAMGDIFDD